MRPYWNIIRRARLFDGIDDGNLERLLECLTAKTVNFPKAAGVFHVGDQAKYIGLLLEGVLSIQQEDFWGNRTIVTKVVPGQLFAESFACTPGAMLNVDVFAETAAIVLFLDVQRLMTLCNSACDFHNRVMRNLLFDMAGKNLRFNEKLTHMAQRTTREKLLSYLSAESLRQKSSVFDIAYTRQQLADYLAVDRSAMSNELGKLRDDGILSFRKNHFQLYRPDEH